MDSSHRLFELLDGLIDGWCERRALVPLRRLLPAYPPPPLHTDQWIALFDGVRATRALGSPLLEDAEIERLAEVHALVWQALKPTEFGRQWMERGDALLGSDGDASPLE